MAKLIFIAGPYRAPTNWQMSKNVQNAREYGALVAQAGSYPVIPIVNTAFMDGMIENDPWISGIMRLLQRSDGVLFIPGWQESEGAKIEYRECLDSDIPLYLAPELPASVDSIREWIDSI